MTGEWKQIKSADGSDMRVFVARPEKASGGKMPGVLVLQEAFGVNAHIREMTSRIAQLGAIAIAPELFHRTAASGFEGNYGDIASVVPHMQAVTETGLTADLQGCAAFLSADSQVDAARMGAIGFCMGGRSAFLANAVLPLKAAVSYYGGRIAPDFLPHAKNQHGPILLFWGGRDKHIGPEQQRAVADALRAAGKPFVDVEFSEADHGFFCDARPSYHPVAARQSLALLKSFFAEHLGLVAGADMACGVAA